MSQRKKGDAPFLILKYLAEYGQASYKDLSENVPLPLRTVEYGIRRLKSFDLVKKLPNDKYALKWYSEEKDEAERLKRKLLRNPTPTEFAFLIKKTQSEARDLLFKFIPDYREPSDEEVLSSKKSLWRMLVLGGVKLPGKKFWFENGIIKVIVEGVDRETLEENLSHKQTEDFDEAENCLKEFPQLKPMMVVEPKGIEIFYKVDWSEEVKQILCNTGSWRQTTEISIPFNYDNDSDCPFGEDSENPWEGFEVAENLASNYVLSPRVMLHFLKFVGLPHYENRVLATLKTYCQNAIEVDQLDSETKDKIALRLKDVAFVRDYEKLHRNYENCDGAIDERNEAFEIIEFLDLRNNELLNIAKAYIDEVGREEQVEEPIEGPGLSRVASWLARDPNLKAEIVKKIDERLQDSYYQKISSILTNLLDSLRKSRT